MTARRYDYFKYRLPKGSAKDYAKNALAILSVVKAKFPEFYDNFRQPSEVLTLSGVRAFDTYYDFGKNANPTRIAELKTFLHKHGILLLEENFEVIRVDNSMHNYSLLHVDAFLRIPKDYGYVPAWDTPVIDRIQDNNDFTLFWLLWKQQIGGMYGKDKKMPAKWYNSWSAIHDITFGMLLGYPGEAICSLIIDGADLMAQIANAETKDGAWPTYGYDPSLKDNPRIVAHQQLWSDILTKVYTKVPKPE